MDQFQIARRAHRILEAVEHSCKNSMISCQLQDVGIHTNGYAEAGYDDPSSGVIATGNWNNITDYVDGKLVVEEGTMGRVADLFTALGIELEWSDEWTTCCTCNKLVRTSPDCCSWTPSYYMHDDCDIVCRKCCDPVEVLEDLEGKSSNALTLDINPEDYGYVKANEESYEHGFHSGQDDDPSKIAASIRAMGIERFIFAISGTGQFDTDFDVYVHDSEAELLTAEPEGKCDLSPAVAAEMALRQGSIEAAKLEGDGIRYVRCKADGTAEARMVSREEFIEGIKD